MGLGAWQGEMGCAAVGAVPPDDDVGPDLIGPAASANNCVKSGLPPAPRPPQVNASYPAPHLALLPPPHSGFTGYSAAREAKG